jgi:hypothetical protein
VFKKGGKKGAGTPSGPWDDELDVGSARPRRSIRAALESELTRLLIAGGCAIALVILAIAGRELAKAAWFAHKLSAASERALHLGGRISTGEYEGDRIWVSFGGPTVTDRDMPGIVSVVRACPNPDPRRGNVNLNLDRSGVGDEGIRHLHGVRGLESVSVRGTKVTKDGVEALRNALPQGYVDVWPLDPPWQDPSWGQVKTQRP